MRSVAFKLVFEKIGVINETNVTSEKLSGWVQLMLTISVY